jgi:mevalonate kinase
MKFYAPAKTFLIGEYVATAGGPAIVLATEPSFSLVMDDSVSGLVNIHSQSPAGIWYAQQTIKPKGLLFSDPYQGKGGLGASSAQFALVYQAAHYFQKRSFTVQSLLSDYYGCSWRGKGIRPSGYDVLTQHSGHSLFIDNHGAISHQLDWPFVDMNALLYHTGNKLATHTHLETQQQPSVSTLKPIVYQALDAWETQNTSAMINCVQTFHQELLALQLVTPGTARLINQLQHLPGVLAAKGCGALGADVILMLVEKGDSHLIQSATKDQGLAFLAEIAISS